MLVPMFYNCGYPRPHVYVMLCEAAFFFTMFMRFYFKAYRTGAAPAEKPRRVIAARARPVKALT
ncbi:hypothetical protein HPB52_007611 [Rhipicephalus sanguineus]|uniref:Very-long-chain 3-oxoacyl-CoA synthase n=1 Tax=Rhipicephalus sanguineus TaxID=34632 RepID=A0A9D4T382_RHISA|nr:hypothetical protein HPB52_007611 [Rhipicephalus sanguineus]